LPIWEFLILIWIDVKVFRVWLQMILYDTVSVSMKDN